MKRLIIIVFLFFVSSSVTGQILQRKLQVVSVITQQTFYLNGGIRSQFGGQSRAIFQINLPQNAIAWYYTLSTQPGQSNNSQSLNLASQLSQLITGSNLLSTLATEIVTPQGSGACDTYLFQNEQNAIAFQDKVDLRRGIFYYIITGSRTNFLNGTVEIPGTGQNLYFLGFKNPSETQGITVTFDVAAIVEE